VKAAKKNKFYIFHGTLQDAGYKEDFFDVITLNHVFEHVDNPLSTLGILKNILKSDGIIRIAVPQKRSLAYWIFGKYWVQLDAPRHFFIYSESTLRRYAKASGLNVLKARYVSSPFQFTQSVVYWAKEKNLRLLGRIFGTRIAFLILFPLSFACNRLHIGDSIEIILSKGQTQR
jgi:2-polyprenyl-3-methyl-5-hydroxy-6-metoxy-1,4-benzoquinol methylase